MIDKPINVKDAEFEDKVLNSDLPVIVDFWAAWCVPCRMIMPALERVAKDNAGKLIVAEVDVDNNTLWAGKYGVQGIPTTLYIYKGNLLHRQVGAVPESVIKTIVEQFLAVAGK